MTHNEKITRHRETYEEFRPLVFCAKCGSNRLDQNFINVLMCYDCGNTMPWDGTRFSIRRYAGPLGEGDVESAIDLAERGPRHSLS